MWKRTLLMTTTTPGCEQVRYSQSHWGDATPYLLEPEVDI